MSDEAEALLASMIEGEALLANGIKANIADLEKQVHPAARAAMNFGPSPLLDLWRRLHAGGGAIALGPSED